MTATHLTHTRSASHHTRTWATHRTAARRWSRVVGRGVADGGGCFSAPPPTKTNKMASPLSLPGPFRPQQDAEWCWWEGERRDAEPYTCLHPAVHLCPVLESNKVRVLLLHFILGASITLWSTTCLVSYFAANFPSLLIRGKYCTLYSTTFVWQLKLVE